MTPVKVPFGVKVMIPVSVFTDIIPGAVPVVTVKELGSFGPPDAPQNPQMETGVLIPVEVWRGGKTGAVPVTLMVISALVHETGDKLHTP